MDTGAALDQRTDDWYQARIGKVTASRAGAVLGVSKFQTREGLMREMVQEYYGEKLYASSPALQWGNDHEDTAIAKYESLTGNLVVSTGLHASGEYPWLAASPDGLVEGEAEPGLLEVKCPYSQQLATLEENQGYYVQVQIQLFVTGRAWCDFFCWTPKGYHKERVLPDRDYMAEILPKLAAFQAEYVAVLADEELSSRYRRPAERDDSEWRDAVERYSREKAAAAVAADREKAAREELIRLAGGENVRGAGCTLSHFVRVGSIDYRAAEAAGIDLSPYRRPSTIQTRVSMK